MDAKFTELVEQLNGLDFKGMYGSDFLHTWDKTTDELKALYIVADALRELRENNVSSKIFDSGLAVSLFRDNSTRTRFSFSKAANLLGLELQDLDEKKSQIAHGETVRETATMISFMADVIGIRDDMYIGKGHAYQKEVVDSVTQGYKDGILEQKPTLVNLQCDIDHPTQCMADAAHIIHEMGGLENLKGKKIAMTWAYSPSYGKPLSVPQGVIGLMTRFGMDVTLAHPKGYEVMPEVEAIAASSPLAVSFLGKSSLMDIPQMALRSLACVGNDTGPTHMCAYAGVPVTAIFCHRTRNSAITARCISNLVSPGAIEEITVDQVWSALEPFLPPQEGFEQIRAADFPHGS